MKNFILLVLVFISFNVNSDFSEDEAAIANGALKKATQGDITGLIRLSDEGNQRAQFFLSKAYGEGVYGLEKDDVKSYEWMRRSAIQGNKYAEDALGIKLLKGNGVEKDLSEAAEWIRKSAEKGLARAQKNLGLMYKRGKGVKKDYREAVRWLKKSYEQNNIKATRHLSEMYREGYGVDRDIMMARRLMVSAAEKSDLKAQLYVAEAYENGEPGYSVSLNRAISWYIAAANKGEVSAMLSLARIYSDDSGHSTAAGITGLHTIEKSIEWYVKAIQEKSEVARKKLIKLGRERGANIYRKAGEMFVNEFYVKKDNKEALYWMRRAASGNDIYAIKYIANAYMKGIGVDKDLQKSVRNYVKADLLGDNSAEYILNELALIAEISSMIALEYKSRGLDKNINKVIDYYRIAAEKNDIGVMSELSSLLMEYSNGSEEMLSESIKWRIVLIESGDDSVLDYLHKLAEENVKIYLMAGDVYFYGNGVGVSQSKAINWYKIAADRGDMRSQIKIADIYSSGNSDSMNDALKYYEMALAQGSGEARNKKKALEEKIRSIESRNKRYSVIYRKMDDGIIANKAEKMREAIEGREIDFDLWLGFNLNSNKEEIVGIYYDLYVMYSQLKACSMVDGPDLDLSKSMSVAKMTMSYLDGVAPIYFDKEMLWEYSQNDRTFVEVSEFLFNIDVTSAREKGEAMMYCYDLAVVDFPKSSKNLLRVFIKMEKRVNSKRFSKDF